MSCHTGQLISRQFSPPPFLTFDGTWKELASSEGITIDENTNSRIIVDGIFSWATSLDLALKYLICQLKICQSQNLSLNLKKCTFFPKRVEFVGTDVCVDGNHPAMSKFGLINSWPTPTIIRDIANFIGLSQFYCEYIPHYKSRIKRMQEILQLPYTEPSAPHWDREAQTDKIPS